MSRATEQHVAPLPRLRQAARALLPFAFWAVVLAAAATVLAEAALPLALAVIAAAAAVRWLAAGAPAVRTPLDWPIAGLAVMAGVSLLLTPAPALTWPQVARLAVGIALFYAVASWAAGEARRRLASLGLAAAGLVLALGSLVSVRWETYKFTFLPRAFYESIQPRVADYVNPNVMAGYLALLLPCVLAPLIFSWRRLRRPARALGVVALVAMCAVLMLTQSRGGLLAAAAGLAALGLLRWGRSRRAQIAVGAAAVLALALSPWIAGAVAANVASMGGPERAEVYRSAAAMIRDHWLLGVGMGAFPRVLNASYPLTLQPQGVPHAHNLFMQVWLDLGLPGLVAWLAAFAAATLAAWRALGRGLAAGDTLLAGFAAGLLGAQVALAAHGALDAVTWGMVRPAVLVWALWGLAAAAARPAHGEA
jgi:putative inorganic carbon (HCO3(-)) transporter